MQPSVLIFDVSFSSWARRLTESKILPSVALYLVLGDPSRISHAANCKITLLTVHVQNKLERSACSSLTVSSVVMGDTSTSIFDIVFSRQCISVVPVEHIKKMVSETAAITPVSAPNDVALICFTSGKLAPLLHVFFFSVGSFCIQLIVVAAALMHITDIWIELEFIVHDII